MKAAKSLLLSLLAIPLVLASGVPKASEETEGSASVFDFQELLAVLPAESLHSALHKHAHNRFQDGVYEHDRIAVERVHHEDPGTATKVLAEAALHQLLKRQNGSDTATAQTTTSTDGGGGGGGGVAPTTTPTTEAPPPPSSTSESDVVVPIEVPTTNDQGESTTIETSAVATPTISVVQSVTTTNDEGNTVTQATTVPAAVVTEDGRVTTTAVPRFTRSTADTRPTDVTTTDSGGREVVLSSVTPGKVITATDADGSTFVTTYTPGGGSVSSLKLITSTLPNGQPTTITSFAAVAADTQGSSPSGTNTPRLQNGADGVRSRSLGAEVVAILGGAFGVAFLL